MAQSESALIDFSQAEEHGHTFGVQSLSAEVLIEAYPEYGLSIDDICVDINYGWGDSFRIVALRDAGVLVFWRIDRELDGHDDTGMPNSMILPITERNLDAAQSISYDEYDSPIFDEFLSMIEHFD